MTGIEKCRQASLFVSNKQALLDMEAKLNEEYEKKGYLTKQDILDAAGVFDDAPAYTLYADGQAIMTCYDMEHTDIFHPEEYYDEIIKQLNKES
jgi:hypothetical protein